MKLTLFLQWSLLILIYFAIFFISTSSSFVIMEITIEERERRVAERERNAYESMRQSAAEWAALNAARETFAQECAHSKRKRDEEEGPVDKWEVEVGVKVMKVEKCKSTGEELVSLKGLGTGPNVRRFAAGYLQKDIYSTLKSMVWVLIGAGLVKFVGVRSNNPDKEWVWIALEWAKMMEDLPKMIRHLADDPDIGPFVARQGNDARYRMSPAEWSLTGGGEPSALGQYDGFLLCPAFLGQLLSKCFDMLL